MTMNCRLLIKDLMTRISLIDNYQYRRIAAAHRMTFLWALYICIRQLQGKLIEIIQSQSSPVNLTYKVRMHIHTQEIMLTWKTAKSWKDGTKTTGTELNRYFCYQCFFPWKDAILLKSQEKQHSENQISLSFINLKEYKNHHTF